MSDGWLADDRCAAVCLSIDDVHPGRSRDHYEAGGDLDRGVLGRLSRLLDHHPQLRATLFVTPDWRERSPQPTRPRLARARGIRRVTYLTPPLPRGSMRLDRHEPFVSYLQQHRLQFEVGIHGLTHFRRGPQLIREFDGLGARAATRRLRRARTLFERAELGYEDGFSTPGWETSEDLQRALSRQQFRWFSSARDIQSPISDEALTASSGIRGVPLIRPLRLAQTGLIHFPSNFQHTSPDSRAFAILNRGGLLSIKAHAVKNAMGHVALDGLDDAYCDRLDRLLCAVEDRYGDAVWWTTMGEIANRMTGLGRGRTEAAG